MPLPFIADVFRTSIRWTNPNLSRDAVNVMHFHGPGKTAANVWTALNAHVTASMWNQTDQQTQAVEVDITPLDNVSNTLVNIPAGTKWEGGVGPGTQVTPQVACIVKLVTGQRGRRHRGRIYLPFVSEAAATNGKMDPTAQAAMGTAWTAFLAAMVADGVVPCVASYVGLTESDVTNYIVESPLATQRRRQPR